MSLIIAYILIPIIVIVLCAVVAGIIYRKRAAVCTCTNDLHGKTVIVTGASAGIGKETAYDLASRGARVILACRNLEKAEPIRKWIVTSTGNINITVIHLDLSDLDSVRKFAKEILENETRLDILINNAACISSVRKLSQQGYELTLATNHYGHFLLTILLLDLIKKSSPSRIINVASSAHGKNNSLNIKDLHFSRRSYGSIKAYAQSKLCNVLFTNELALRLQETGVTVNSVHPGAVSTEIFRNGTVFGYIADCAFRVGAKTEKSGAQTTIHVAVSDEVNDITGKYFAECKVSRTSRESRDPELAKKLWEITEEEVKLTSKEKDI